MHLVNIVTLDGLEYVVDVGYGAPFDHPMPRFKKSDHTIESGNENYVLEPVDGEGCSKMVQYRNGEVLHGYKVKPQGREIGYFDRMIADSFTDKAGFMNRIIAVRFFEDRSLTIRNLSFIETQGRDTSVTKLSNFEEVVEILSDKFGIKSDITSTLSVSLTSN